MTTDDTRDLRPFRSKEFPLRARSRSVPIEPGILVDSVGGLDFIPRSIVIGIGSSTSYDDLSPTGEPTLNPPDGGISFELVGLTNFGQPFLRRFTLDPWRTSTWDISAFRDVRVKVISVSSTLIGVSCGAWVTDAPLNVNLADYVLYTEMYTTPGRYLVPPGAREAFPATADVGFSWRPNNAGAGLVIPSALVVGVAQQVQGGQFTTTAPNVGISWRVSVA